MSNTAIAPIAKQRQSVFKKMTPALQEVASEFESKLARCTSSVILIEYNMGARVKDILANDGKYGTGAVGQLAAYLPVLGDSQKSRETMLYNLKNFATEFTKEQVQSWSSKPMSNGNFMTLSHWLQLMKVKDKDDQEKILRRIIDKSLSANDIETEIRAGSAKIKHSRQGGRKPSVPSSAISGLQKMFEMAQKLNNYVPVFDESVAKAIESMPADEITEALEANLEKTVNELNKTAEEATEMREKAEVCLDRVKEILETKAEEKETEDEEAEEPKEKKGKKEKKAKSSKPETNGSTKKGKKAKKVKVTAGGGEDEDEDEDSGSEPE